MFFELSITVYWHGVISHDSPEDAQHRKDEELRLEKQGMLLSGLRDKSEHLQGEIRIWNISHATEKSEWQHEIRRAEDPSGPWQDRIYARYAPELVPMALQGVGDVLEKFAQKGATIDVP